MDEVHIDQIVGRESSPGLQTLKGAGLGLTPNSRPTSIMESCRSAYR